MWSLPLREVYRLQKFENKVLMKIFVAKKDEVLSVRIEMPVGN